MGGGAHNKTFFRFTVRLWQEKLGDGQAEWRGKVQYVSRGEALYFRDWSTLIAFLQMLLPVPESSQKFYI